MRWGLGLHPEIAIKAVGEAIAALHEAEFTRLTDDQLAESVIELHGLLSSLEAATTRIVGITDARRAIEDDGARSMGEWIAWRARIPKGRAMRTARNARSLRCMPRVEDAFRGGEISGEHLRLFAEAETLNSEAFERDVDMLLGEAKRLLYSQFTRVLRYWRYVNAPEKSEQEAADADATRTAHCSMTFGGMYVIDALLPAVGGTIVANEWRRLEREEFDADVREARDRLGRPPTRGDLRRTAEAASSRRARDDGTSLGCAPPEPAFRAPAVHRSAG